MKVVALNGSPRKNGNTFTALEKVCSVLNAEGIETEIINIGSLKLTGCHACGFCAKNGKCAIDDGMNEIAPKLLEADGLVIGSPVYYADINATLKCFLDRFFYVYGGGMRFKPGAAVVALRRGGAIHAYHSINSYFGITEMLITPSMYWNDIHGAAAGECVQDVEGMQLMEAIGRNMSYLIKLRAESKTAPPEKLPKIKFNYVR